MVLVEMARRWRRTVNARLERSQSAVAARFPVRESMTAVSARCRISGRCVGRISVKRKALVLAGFVVEAVVAWGSTWNVPYSANAAVITLIHVLLPLIGSLLVVWASRKQRQRRGRI